jgi:glycosyltransferase involved in cell wall biosynthesis
LKVSISINGRFHHFDLAKELQKHNCLHELITSYPKFKAVEWGIPRYKVKSLPYLEIIKKIICHIPVKTRFFNFLQKKLYGKITGYLIDKDIDVFVFFAGNGFNSELISILKKRGVLCIADEGSSHVLYQNLLLKEESRIVKDIRYNDISDAIIAETVREYELADYISVPSLFVKRSFMEMGIAENKLLHIPYGVDLSNFYPVKKEDDVFRVIFVGSLIPRKGIHYLLQAFFELNLPDSELWLIGGRKKESQKYIDKYNNGKIILYGPQPQNRLHWYYSQCNLFCHPSIEEGLSMVQMQSMACALPLICTTNTGGDDLIENDKEGYVVPIRDVEALKEKILYLYNNKDLCKEMGTASRRKVTQGYTWSDYGRNVFSTYSKLLNK